MARRRCAAALAAGTIALLAGCGATQTESSAPEPAPPASSPAIFDTAPQKLMCLRVVVAWNEYARSGGKSLAFRMEASAARKAALATGGMDADHRAALAAVEGADDRGLRNAAKALHGLCSGEVPPMAPPPSTPTPNPATPVRAAAAAPDAPATTPTRHPTPQPSPVADRYGPRS